MRIIEFLVFQLRKLQIPLTLESVLCLGAQRRNVRRRISTSCELIEKPAELMSEIKEGVIECARRELALGF